MDGITFNWMDGIFGMCLSPDPNLAGNRVLYFHSLSSNNEFYVPTASLRNATLRTGDLFEHFAALNDSRCHRYQSCQSSAMAMDDKGVMFYNLVVRGKVGCWNSNREFGPDTHGVLSSGPSATLSFPNDLKVDKEPVQRVWVLSNGLHKYLYGKVNPAEINYRVMMAYTDSVTKGTVCEWNRIYLYLGIYRMVSCDRTRSKVASNDNRTQQVQLARIRKERVSGWENVCSISNYCFSVHR